MNDLLKKLLDLKNEQEKGKDAEQKIIALFKETTLPLYSELKMGDIFWFLTETTIHKGMKVNVIGDSMDRKYLCLDETSQKWNVYALQDKEQKVIPINTEEK